MHTYPHALTQHAENCIKCTEGRYQSFKGKSVCIKCEKHSYSDTMGNTECTRCPIWEYQNTEGANECESCFTMSIAFGFAEPQQCIMIWLMLGAVLGILVLVRI